jgi:hypothetical protein
MGRGKRRTNGPAVEQPDGVREWWLNGKRHREDGPAVESADGMRSWYLNGKLHREDGPAVEEADGGREWWLDNEHLTEAEHAATVAIWEEDRAAEAAAATVIRPGVRLRVSALGG